MSAIAGICHWDGRPVAESELNVLALHSRAAGPDGSGTVSPIPGLALQAHVRHFDRLSTTERQPHAFAAGSVLTWDGRLDNRDDLLVTLHHDLGPDLTDAAIVAAAYARWGLDAIPRLIGDWSLTLFDAPQHRLILARDYMGNRPLYYLEIQNGLAWATSLDALADCFDLYRVPDESYIAGQLTNGVPPDLTPFRGIRALQAGHLLLSSQNTSAEIRRYWTFRPSRIRYRDLQEYADHARLLLTEGVRVRLRTRGRVWSHLSGGYDSSSLVCLAHALVRRGGTEASAIQPISRVTRASPESDETPYITAVERWSGLTTVRREPSNRSLTFEELLTRRRPHAYTAADTLEAPMVAAGDHVVLSGELGDVVMIRGSAQVVSLLEALSEGRIREFLQLCLARARRRHRPLLPFLVHLALKGYLPQLDVALHRRRTRVSRVDQLTGGIHRDVALEERVTPAVLASAPQRHPVYPSVAEFPTAKRALVNGLYRFTDHPALSNTDLTPEIGRTFPFSHRPLVEFITGVPQLAFWDPNVTRAGMKRALADVLPPEILRRPSKGDPRVANARARLAQAADFARTTLPPEPPEDWLLVAKGYVQRQPLADVVNAALMGGPTSGFLRLCVHLEAWMRAIDGPSFVARPATPPAANVSWDHLSVVG